jgi:hypothetical protein
MAEDTDLFHFGENGHVQLKRIAGKVRVAYPGQPARKMAQGEESASLADPK